MATKTSLLLPSNAFVYCETNLQMVLCNFIFFTYTTKRGRIQNICGYLPTSEFTVAPNPNRDTPFDYRKSTKFRSVSELISKMVVYTLSVHSEHDAVSKLLDLIIKDDLFAGERLYKDTQIKNIYLIEKVANPKSGAPDIFIHTDKTSLIAAEQLITTNPNIAYLLFPTCIYRTVFTRDFKIYFIAAEESELQDTQQYPPKKPKKEPATTTQAQVSSPFVKKGINYYQITPTVARQLIDNAIVTFALNREAAQGKKEEDLLLLDNEYVIFTDYKAENETAYCKKIIIKKESPILVSQQMASAFNLYRNVSLYMEVPIPTELITIAATKK